VNQPRAGHRLNDRADGLAVNLVDPPRERPQRVDIGRHDELVEVLSLIGDKTDVKLASTEI
jgi:hypothetical protein